MGENHFAPMPTALYGVVLLMAAIAYYILQQAIIAPKGRNSVLAARRRAATGRASCRPSSTCSRSCSRSGRAWLAEAIYVVVALIWLVPDRRIEHALQHKEP